MPKSNEMNQVESDIIFLETKIEELRKDVNLIIERLDNTLGKYIKEEQRHIRIECEKCGKLLTRQNDGDIVGGDDGGNAIHKHFQCMEDYDRDYVKFFKG